MTPEETFQKLLEARGLSGAQSISVEVAKEMFCAEVGHQQQAYSDIDQTLKDHMEVCESGRTLSVRAIFDRLGEGVVVNAPRRSGKTTALLDFLATRSPGERRIAYICGDHKNGECRQKEELTRRRLRGIDDGNIYANVMIVSGNDEVSIGSLHSWSTDIVIDEWWELKPKTARYLASNFRVIAAVGTLRPGEKLPLKESMLVLDRDDIEKEIEYRAKKRAWQLYQAAVAEHSLLKKFPW
jgi:hypothetical protein